MGDLLIPRAITFVDEVEKLIVPAQAQKGHELKCPECLNVVVLRRASRDESGSIIRRTHFAHLADLHDSTCSGGTGEGQVHKTAKLLVLQAIQEWMTGDGLRPHFTYKCSCGHELRRYLPFVPSFAKAEYVLECGRKPDVFVSDRDQLGAIEILKSHRIESEKIDLYSSDLSWWIEVEADPVLEDPSRWVVVRSSFKREEHCPHCIESKVNDLKRQVKELDQARSFRSAALDGVERRRLDLHKQITESELVLKRNTESLERAKRVADEVIASEEFLSKQRIEGMKVTLQSLESLRQEAERRKQQAESEAFAAALVARKRDEIVALEKVLIERRNEIGYLDRHIKGQKDNIDGLEKKANAVQNRIPDDVKRSVFDSYLSEARSRGYKASSPRYKYKEEFGVFPPWEWDAEATAAFASDPDWQARNRERERFKVTSSRSGGGNQGPPPPPF